MMAMLRVAVLVALVAGALADSNLAALRGNGKRQPETNVTRPVENVVEDYKESTAGWNLIECSCPNGGYYACHRRFNICAGHRCWTNKEREGLAPSTESHDEKAVQGEVGNETGTDQQSSQKMTTGGVIWRCTCPSGQDWCRWLRTGVPQCMRACLVA
mmetsp:Transcript_126271/g.365526  ORF Transcript_126271/g.365526 Transcript_126271/m.365526 type:complete len:158 (-) Transcript_126271:168-641(-)